MGNARVISSALLPLPVGSEVPGRGYPQVAACVNFQIHPWNSGKGVFEKMFD
jgi:hypothetical protein